MDYSKEENFLSNNEFEVQRKKLYQALLIKPSTRFEVAKLINVDRSNICRYVSYFLDRNLIAVTRIRRCNISGYPYVEELTTNKDLFPGDNQMYFDY